MARIHPLWDEFILWLNASPAERGEVSTEEEWAAAHELTDRTLRRWKKDEAFLARQAELASRFGSAPTTAVVNGDATADESDYRVVKAKLVEGAKQGNPKYLDLYLKAYGKPFIDEENASRSADLANLELDAVIEQAIALVGHSAVAEHLRSAGWTVTEPANG